MHGGGPRGRGTGGSRQTVVNYLGNNRIVSSKIINDAEELYGSHSSNSWHVATLEVVICKLGLALCINY